MVRSIMSVVAGYVVMAAFVFLTFTMAYLAMGAGGAFMTGTYEVTPGWIAVSVVFSFIAAVLGGLVCASIARNKHAHAALAALVLILGFVFAIPVLTAPADDVPKLRTGDVGNTEAMQNAKQPDWLVILNPLLGATGVLIGARFNRKRD